MIGRPGWGRRRRTTLNLLPRIRRIAVIVISIVILAVTTRYPDDTHVFWVRPSVQPDQTLEFRGNVIRHSTVNNRQSLDTTEGTRGAHNSGHGTSPPLVGRVFAEGAVLNHSPSHLIPRIQRRVRRFRPGDGDRKARSPEVVIFLFGSKKGVQVRWEKGPLREPFIIPSVAIGAKIQQIVVAVQTRERN